MKTVTEWSLEFDLLYDNITSHKAPGLTSYEKSVFLTRAEESVELGLYRGAFGDAFESTEEVTAYLNTLVKQADGTAISGAALASMKHIRSDTQIYSLEDDVLVITLEWCYITPEGCSTPVQVPVIPVTQDEYFRTVRNPFKKQNGRKVLRVTFGKGELDAYDKEVEKRYSELVSDYHVSTYTYRYLAKPEPIILETLTGGLSINGKTEAKTCLFPESLHQTILAEAVRLAKAVWES